MVLVLQSCSCICNAQNSNKLISARSGYQVMTQADLGLADAYINGDFSFVDKDEGLLNLFMVRLSRKPALFYQYLHLDFFLADLNFRF